MFGERFQTGLLLLARSKATTRLWLPLGNLPKGRSDVSRGSPDEAPRCLARSLTRHHRFGAWSNRGLGLARTNSPLLPSARGRRSGAHGVTDTTTQRPASCEPVRRGV